MKTAICFTGTGRSIEHTFSNIERNVIEPFYGSDIIVYITETPNAEKTKDYFDLIHNSHIHIVKEERIDSSKYVFDGQWPGPRNGSIEHGRDIFIQMLKARSHINNLIDQTGKEYDRVIFSRMDVLYENPIKEKLDGLDLTKLWIPNFHNWLGGYNDRFAVSSRENMRHYFSIYDRIDQYAEEGHVFQAENTLKYHLDKSGIPVSVFEFYFARVGVSGEAREDFERIKNEALRPCDI